MAVSAFEPPKLLVERVVSTAVLPCRSSPGAAGFDLCPVLDYTIEPKCRMMVRTGLRVGVPRGTYGRVVPCPGLALRSGVDVMSTVLEADYRHELGVILINHGSAPFHVKACHRVAQLILEKVELNAEVAEVTPDQSDGFESTMA